MECRLAEFDKRRMNLVQLHAFPEEDRQEVTRRWQAMPLKKMSAVEYQDVNFLHCSDNVELLEVRIRLLRPASRLNDD